MRRLAAKHFRFAGFEVNGAKRLLLRQGVPVALNPKAFDLLLALIDHRGSVLSKNELLEYVWPDQYVEEGNLTVQISVLRKLFGETAGENRFIVTIPGQGYSFVAETLEQDVDADEVVIERHSLARVVIEEEETLSSLPDVSAARTRAVTRPGSSSAGPRGRRLLIAGAVIMLTASAAFALWVYQRSFAMQPLALMWTDGSKTKKPIQLTTNGKVAYAALSPDGQYFAYATGQTDEPSLWYAHTNGKQQMQIRPPEPVKYDGLTFAPDSAEIYYIVRDKTDGRGVMYRMPVLGGAPTRVVSNIESQITFSPDGKRIAFVRLDYKRKLSVLTIANAADGGDERELAVRPLEKRFKVVGVSWSPNGKLIAVGVINSAGSDDEVDLVDVSTGEAAKFGETSFQEVRRLAWLKDGSGLFVNAIEKGAWDDRHLWLIGYPNGKPTKVTQDLFHYGAFNLSVSDDGTRLLAVSSTKISNIYTAPSGALSREKKITANALGKLSGFMGLAWTASGEIVYSSFFDKSQTLSVMDAGGANVRPLTSPGAVDVWPNVTEDDRYVVFSSTRGGEGWGVWRIGLDGSDLKKLASTDAFTPRVSADSHWALYPARGGGNFISIWGVPVDGGEAVRLTSAVSDNPSISPDGKMFACSYLDKGKEKLAVFPIAGGEPLYLFDVPAKTSFASGIRWSPDGTSVVYRDVGPVLWRQRLSGGDPEKALELTDGAIYSFGWSRDGAQFAVAHGEDVRDVVLVTTDE